ncbi:MAG: hypothetical protein JNJ88_09445 [Planctomycetes bacterium]|nr:hypothetical protein [Planctomycetota bacterium]
MSSSKASVGDVHAALAKSFRKYRSFQGVNLLDRLVLLLIGREVPSSKADAVLDRIKKDFVDWNEVRLARIDDLREILDATGCHDAPSRAMRLRDLLSKIFTDRHALDAEFLREEDKDKRATFLAASPGLDFAMVQAFEASLLEEKGEIPTTPQAQRVAQRLGWIPKGGAPPVTKVRKALLDMADGDPVNLTYGLVRVAEDYCHVRNPECPKCPFHGCCPAGKKWKENGAAVD